MKYIKVFFLAMLLVAPGIAIGAVGTCTTTLSETFASGTGTSVSSGQSLPSQKTVTFTCTGGAAGDENVGTWPATAIPYDLTGWYLYKVMTNPGATAPEDNWDFTLVDGHGIDVLGGAGANRHTTTSQMIAPLLTTGVYFAQPVLGTWTFTPSGNTTASAIIVVDFVFVR